MNTISACKRPDLGPNCLERLSADDKNRELINYLSENMQNKNVFFFGNLRKLYAYFYKLYLIKGIISFEILVFAFYLICFCLF